MVDYNLRVRARMENLKKLVGHKDQFSSVLALIEKCFLDNGHLIFAGNGGSAADSMHLAGEFSGRFKKNRIGLPAGSLSSDTALMTCIANDFGYEAIFSRQVDCNLKSQDLLVLLSTSGNSANIVAACKAAKKKSIVTVGVTGERTNQLSQICDISLRMPASETAEIQELYMTFFHIICEAIDDKY